jgi:hypothetical protein
MAVGNWPSQNRKTFTTEDTEDRRGKPKTKKGNRKAGEKKEVGISTKAAA